MPILAEPLAVYVPIDEYNRIRGCGGCRASGQACDDRTRDRDCDCDLVCQAVGGGRPRDSTIEVETKTVHS